MAKLVINPTSAAKKEILIVSRVISIGRDPSNDLVLSDSMVSRRHAILEQRDNQFVLRDNNSSNGTLVNGDRVENEKPLRDGDLVAIGSSRLLFQLDDTAEASLSPHLAVPEVVPAAPPHRAGTAPEAPKSEAPGSGAEARCGACGKAATTGDRFCRFCGHDLSGGKKTVPCAKCGADVPVPADFCGQCGNPLSANDRGPILATRPHRRADLEAGLAKVAAEERAAPSTPPPVARPRPRPPGSGLAKSPASEETAGFGIRFLAFLVDEMILGIPLLVGGLLFLAPAISTSSTFPVGRGLGAGVTLFSLVYSVLCALYFVLFWGARGATPGKSLLGLVVKTDTGETPIGYSRAALRLLGYGLSFAFLGLGFLLILLSEDRLGLHDRIAGTRVTRSH